MIAETRSQIRELCGHQTEQLGGGTPARELTQTDVIGPVRVQAGHQDGQCQGRPHSLRSIRKLVCRDTDNAEADRVRP
ncbi:MAG: hypothetical protein GEEBNDBF_02073 [bacterium]|nr:hypothetical protein [bacterium]